VSKFLLNLLVQIFKALVYSKIKFYSNKNFPRHFRPIRPLGPISFFFTGKFPSPSHWASAFRSAQPTCTAQPATFLLPPARKLGAHGAGTGRPHAASTVAPTPPPEEKNGHIQSPFISPHYSAPFPPSSIPETGTFNPAIEAPSSRQLKALGSPRPHLRPIKADPSHGEAFHTSNAPSPSPHRAHAIVLPSRGFRRRCAAPLPPPEPRKPRH
jgi:hypothetical protein